MLIYARCVEQYLAHSKPSVSVLERQVPVISRKGFYLFAALWWPVNTLDDLKCKVDPLCVGYNADQMMMTNNDDDDDDRSVCSLFH